MSNSDISRLKHMLDAAQAAVNHLHKRNREDLERDRLLINGVIRKLEILGGRHPKFQPKLDNPILTTLA